MLTEEHLERNRNTLAQGFLTTGSRTSTYPCAGTSLWVIWLQAAVTELAIYLI